MIAPRAVANRRIAARNASASAPVSFADGASRSAPSAPRTSSSPPPTAPDTAGSAVFKCRRGVDGPGGFDADREPAHRPGHAGGEGERVAARGQRLQGEKIGVVVRLVRLGRRRHRPLPGIRLDGEGERLAVPQHRRLAVEKIGIGVGGAHRGEHGTRQHGRPAAAPVLRELAWLMSLFHARLLALAARGDARPPLRNIKRWVMACMESERPREPSAHGPAHGDAPGLLSTPAVSGAAAPGCPGTAEAVR